MASLNLKQSQRPIIHFSLLLFYAIKWKRRKKDTEPDGQTGGNSETERRRGHGERIQMTSTMKWIKLQNRLDFLLHRPNTLYTRARDPIGNRLEVACASNKIKTEEREREKKQAIKNGTNDEPSRIGLCVCV